MRKLIYISFTVVAIVGISYFIFFRNSKEISNIIVKPLVNKEESIVVVSPIKNALVSSPLVVSGRAVGSWFFEGSFPIILQDSYRNVIAEGHATAQGEWTTNDFVKFIGTLQFNNYIKGQNGFLILKRDNPSDLVENNKSIEIPIVFK